MWVWVLVCAGALAVLLYFEARAKAPEAPPRAAARAARVNAVLKPVASASFIAAAVLCGATASRGGQALLIALVWSALGDVLLIARARLAFLFGMAAFAMAHVAYAMLFKLRGLDAVGVAVGAIVAGAVGLALYRWLRPHLARRAPGLAVPVAGYIVVISLMVAFAVGTVAEAWDPLPLAGAITFWLSDLTVALVRFADARHVYRIVGLPLYYAAQFLFVAMLPGAT